jgi:Ca2+-binding EF-hand superfamily protein
VTNALRFATAAALLTLASAGSAQAPAAKSISRADYLKTVDARFARVDTNHDGSISRQEMVAQQQRDLQAARAKIAQDLQAKFRQLDTNKDGQLSLQEFLAAAPQIKTTETPDQMVQQLDTNHDGKVSPDEFRAPDIAKFNRIDANRDGIVTQAEMQAASRK